MSWRIANAAEVGTSHVTTGRPCEDSCWAQVDATAAGMPVLSIFVADGAGSAARGGEGADLAVQAAASFIVDKLKLFEFGLSDDLAVSCVIAIREKLYAVAAAESLTARDYACTFLGVISSEQATLVLQVGDGGIALDMGDGLEVPIAPMVGEYANMTHFITDENAVNVLVTKTFSGPAVRVAVFSDGLQRLALNMATNTVHEPFFAQFFRVLGDLPANKEDEMNAALARFLRSSAVNERTDDDKTLALAMRVN